MAAKGLIVSDIMAVKGVNCEGHHGSEGVNCEGQRYKAVYIQTTTFETDVDQI